MSNTPAASRAALSAPASSPRTTSPSAFTRAGTGSSAIVTSNSPRVRSPVTRRRPRARARAATRPCSARPYRGRCHSTVRLWPSPSGPTAHVLVYAESPPAGPSSTTQIGRAPRGDVGCRAGRTRPARRRPRAGAVSTVTARSGTARSPRLATSSCSVVGLADPLLAGERRARHLEVEAPPTGAPGILCCRPASAAASAVAASHEPGEASARSPHPGGDHTSANDRPAPVWRAGASSHPSTQAQFSRRFPFAAVERRP